MWLEAGLDAVRERLQQRCELLHEPGAAEVALIEARQLGAGGAVLSTAANIVGQTSRPRPVIAVMRLADRGVAIVSRSGPAMARAQRVYTDLGVLEVIGGDLVIVELAPGVSAVDMQTHAEPTLEISVGVRQMVVSSPPSLSE